jgi:general secretion pathway protein C
VNALIFRRYFWVVNGVFILLATLLVSNTVNLFVEDALLPPLPGEEAFRQPGATLAKAQEQAATPLDGPRLAKLTGLTFGKDEPVVRLNDGPAAEEGLVRSSLRVKLLGTLLSNEDQWSTAALQELDNHRARSVRVGDELLGARVVSIERKRIIVSNNGRDEFIDGESQPGLATSTPVRPPPGSPMGPAAVSDASGIRATGEHSYEIPGTELQGALSRLDQLTMQARAMPAMENGQVVGFKLAAIRQGSLYTKIGLQNGDVLRRINGLTLDSPEKALEAFAKLRESKHIQLDIDRGGAPVRKFYNVM